jgi:hypothetical protein
MCECLPAYLIFTAKTTLVVLKRSKGSEAPPTAQRQARYAMHFQTSRLSKVSDLRAFEPSRLYPRHSLRAGLTGYGICS